MKPSGYKLIIHAELNITFEDSKLDPSDGSFYIKSIQCEDDGVKILSTFSDGSDKETPSQSLVLADFWEEFAEFRWYKEFENSDYWVVIVGGEVIIEPINHPEGWSPVDGRMALLEIEFRHDGDSPPEPFRSVKFIGGLVEDVIPMVQDEFDDWVELEDEE